ncbi:putative PHRB protein [Agaricus bisporus var. bisporus H97]|uniref:putative PHRB protein n=1 Tax=Agaricus bisporus var. bisporus (strain H97 / ATCC MYA-4626 / FGSC 10389) TaxID=936046 RepID=UPI00029F59F7|nr:putative PHRB protein [Agaricus bisporus var. bisporus H97]EKV49972.1 putative PHRB protein [Agaricus bisporus var. bisporus H97]
MSATSQTNTISNPLSTFEFTKRKRWADILVTGLTDVIIFVLSPEGKVLYCGTAVNELLGWNETDILDLRLDDFIIEQEQTVFQRALQNSIRTNTELLSYVRFKCNPAAQSAQSSTSDILFEIKGYPHFVSDQDPECKCFFAMAKPYPSRNTAMLNTFLELQMENERLQQCLAALKLQVDSRITASGHTLPSVNSMYATSLPSGGQYSSSLDGALNTATATYDNNLLKGNYNGDSSQTQNPEDLEDSSRRKKLKKTHILDQHVCRKCGRTDSPEWRKGPDGPKTLCNACGLRWAKQMRRLDEPSEENTASTSTPGSETVNSNA